MTSIRVLDSRPIVVAIAGPNGAGKSTFYRSQLQSSGLSFVNADEIARRLGIDAYRAAEVAGRIRDRLVEQRESFLFETVFSDPVGDKLAFLKRAQAAGFTVVLIFIGIDRPETCEERVSMRVAKGGHDVPRGKIVSRFGRVLENLRRSLRELPHVLVYDNSSLDAPYRLVAAVEDGLLRLVPPTPRWLRSLLP